MSDAPAPDADDAPLLDPPTDVDPGPPLEPPPAESDPSAEPVEAARPEFLPEKFWDAEAKTPRLEQLAKSYAELEKKFTASRTKGKEPAAEEGPPEVYELELPEGMEALDDADAEVFRDMGLNNEQAQKALNYLHGQLMPALVEATATAEKATLAAEWGMKPGDEAFSGRMKALRDWAYENFPKPLVAHMSRTADGVHQLYQLMQSTGTTTVAGGAPPEGRARQDELVQMMQDPRYAAGDEAFIAQVERRAGLRA